MGSTVPFFIKTDSRCEINGISYADIPIFFDDNGVIWPLSDYMIWLVYQCRKPASTVETYTYYLQKFLKHINEQEINWSDVTDRDLIRWRDQMIDIECLRRATAVARLLKVFHFYQWAEESGILKYAVATYDECNEQSCSCHDRMYQISAVKKGRNNYYTWPYLPNINLQANRHTPVNEEIEMLHVEAFKSSTGQRDSLLLSFYEELCLRRMEALSITVKDIPSWDEIEEYIGFDKPFILTILGKRNRVRHVPVLPELMSRAREYIEGQRRVAIKSAKSRNSTFKPPDELFIGVTTAKPLSKEYVSRRISELMRSTGIKYASGHRLRASGLTALAEAYDGVDETGRPFSAEQVLWKVADHAGHANPSSLQPYLNIARSPKHGSNVEKGIRDNTRLHLLRRENAELKAKLKKRGNSDNKTGL